MLMLLSCRQSHFATFAASREPIPLAPIGNRVLSQQGRVFQPKKIRRSVLIPQMKNRNAIQAIRTISAEYFSPARTRPSPMTPAASPEKNPWIRAAWQKTRL